MTKICLNVKKHWDNNLRIAKKVLGHFTKNGILLNDIYQLSLGVRNCSYCIGYLKHSCSGCPVEKITGKTTCVSTPYKKVVWLHELVHNSDMEGCLTVKVLEYLVNAIEEEVNFLKQTYS